MTYTLKPLLVGVRNVDQGIMTYQRGYGKRIWLPMYAFLVQGDGHNIIVDTGLEDFMTPQEFIDETGLEPKYMEEALEEHGLTPDDIDIVINTHLHDGHCGNNPLFTKAKHYVQAKEVAFCKHPHAVDYRYDEDYLEDLELVELDGDTEILPGINTIFTPGHTPGAQTVTVETAKGKVIITGMCSNNENFKNGNVCCPGVHTDAIAAYDSAEKVCAMEGTILPLHELSVAKMTF